MSWLTRFWERVRRVSHPEVPRPVDMVHFSPEPYGYPLCGARLGSPWALNVEAVTCPACRREGTMIALQYGVNTR